MDAVSYLRMDMQWAHEFLEMTLGDLTDEQLHWHPPGVANPISATYAHAICGEDAIIHNLLVGEPALYEGEWSDKCGISEPQWGAEFEWGRRLRVDLDKAREYAQAVFAATDEYMASLGEADLDRMIDLTAQGFEKRSIGWMFSALLISHAHNMAGEISALKGLQGLKGYPW